MLVFSAKAIEYMITDALLAAEPYLKIAEQIDKPEKYVHLTDDIMPEIERSNAPVSFPSLPPPPLNRPYADLSPGPRRIALHLRPHSHTRPVQVRRLQDHRVGPAHYLQGAHHADAHRRRRERMGARAACECGERGVEGNRGGLKAGGCLCGPGRYALWDEGEEPARFCQVLFEAQPE